MEKEGGRGSARHSGVDMSKERDFMHWVDEEGLEICRWDKDKKKYVPVKCWEDLLKKYADSK